jgi:hypothetical protein
MVLGSQPLEAIIIKKTFQPLKLKNMKNIFKIFPVISLLIIESCSFANKSTVIVPINSNPPGASVMIDGKNYGQTPLFAELIPNKNYKAKISKAGYDSTTIDMESLYSLRGGESADGARCMADVVSLTIPYFVVLLFAPEKCGSFKQSDYFVDLSVRKFGGNNVEDQNQSFGGGANQFESNFQYDY